MLFKIGDEVQWSKVVSMSRESNSLFGIVNAVITNENELEEEFTMYEVQFGFGLFTISGTQLKAA